MLRFFNFYTNLFTVILLLSSFTLLLLPQKGDSSNYEDFSAWVQYQIDESQNNQTALQKNPIFSQFKAAFGEQLLDKSNTELLNNDAFVKQLFLVWKQYFGASDMAGTFQTDRHHTLNGFYKSVYSKLLLFIISGLNLPGLLAEVPGSTTIQLVSFIPFESIPLINGISINAP